VDAPDGTEVLLRPVKPEDEPLVKEMLTSLSEKSLKERFFQVIKSITHEMLIKLCNIDYNREITIVAEIMAEIRENSSKKLSYHRTHDRPRFKEWRIWGDHP